MRNKVNSRDKKRASRGFTIVEVVVALTVIVIVSAAGMMMVQSQIKAEQKVAQTIEATNIAENAIECFRFAKNNEGSDGFEKTFEDTFGKTNYNLVTATEGKEYLVYESGLTVHITITDNKIEISAVNSNGDTILEEYTYTKQ
nr:type II secretion system protein [Oscillospiraceae bacterium]